MRVRITHLPQIRLTEAEKRRIKSLAASQGMALREAVHEAFEAGASSPVGVLGVSRRGAGGLSVWAIAERYRLTQEQVEAVLQFAAEGFVLPASNRCLMVGERGFGPLLLTSVERSAIHSQPGANEGGTGQSKSSPELAISGHPAR